MYINFMRYDWDPDKNEWLKKERKISFEVVVFHLSAGDVWKVADHPNQSDYPGQRIYFVNIDGYVYMVPYVIEEDHIFLKTIIPSRKATKDFQKGGDADEAG